VSSWCAHQPSFLSSLRTSAAIFVQTTLSNSVIFVCESTVW
jgi:hypothetical protein